MSIHNEGEYGSPITKTKISRARKMVIGMLAVGTAVALGGAGTFASFSASTTNNGTFSTENLKLTNSVDGGTTCSSDEGASVIDNSGGASSNDSTCASLWTATENDLGTTYQSDVVLTNGGTEAHNIFLWNTGACVSNATASAGIAGDGDLCTAAKVTIERLAGDGGGAACLFPAGVPTACDTIATEGVSLGSIPTSFTTKAAVTSADLDAGDFTTIRVKIRVPHHSTCGTDATTTDSGSPYDLVSTNGGGTATADSGGLFNTKGVSCDNHYINKKAELLLKWWMESAN